MYNVVNIETGKSSTVNFAQLSSMVKDGLDEDFFTEAFKDHTLTGKDGKLVVMEESK